MNKANILLRASLIAGLLLSAGCAGLSSGSVDPGTLVQINTNFEIPGSKARVYIQNGVHPGFKDLDKWHTFCSVLMQEKHVSGEPALTVSPGSFEVIKVRKYTEQWADHYLNPAQVYDEIVYRVDMRLKSDEQPGVRSLICAKHFAGVGAPYPTQEEMKTALGDLIEIKAP
jgi:hypothetical protein